MALNIQKVTEKIQALKKEKSVTVLAHYYQTLDVIKISDNIGDSLGLAKIAKNEVETPYILFAGVKFMAETASILNQDKVIISPDIEKALCPMADFLTPKKIYHYKELHPKAPLIVYVNTTAETKALADVCCTSSNSLTICNKVAQNWKTNKILFGPDKNLADYVRSQTDLEVITVPEDGNCPYHNIFSLEDVKNAKEKYPKAILLVHPEAPKEVQEQAEMIGSTAQMKKYIEENDIHHGAILGTEIGLTEYLKDNNPHKKLYPLSEKSNCHGMKAITLKNILQSLESIGTDHEKDYEVKVPKEISEKAKVCINRMIEYS